MTITVDREAGIGTGGLDRVVEGRDAHDDTISTLTGPPQPNPADTGATGTAQSLAEAPAQAEAAVASQASNNFDDNATAATTSTGAEGGPPSSSACLGTLKWIDGTAARMYDKYEGVSTDVSFLDHLDSLSLPPLTHLRRLARDIMGDDAILEAGKDVDCGADGRVSDMTPSQANNASVALATSGAGAALAAAGTRVDGDDESGSGGEGGVSTAEDTCNEGSDNKEDDDDVIVIDDEDDDDDADTNIIHSAKENNDGGKFRAQNARKRRRERRTQNDVLFVF